MEAVRLAAAELTLRVREERRRREAGLKQNLAPQHIRMAGKPGWLLLRVHLLCRSWQEAGVEGSGLSSGLRCAGDLDAIGVHTNTEDTDCKECKCDLWMSAIVSKACPGDTCCPEHAAHLRCDPGDWILLYRWAGSGAHSTAAGGSDRGQI